MIDNESGEDYLEAVLRLSSTGKDVHSVDVARELKVSMNKGYINIIDNHIHLTSDGEDYARKVYAKHRSLTDFLIKLGVDAMTAETDACRMEHLISEETYGAICKFIGK